MVKFKVQMKTLKKPIELQRTLILFFIYNKTSLNENNQLQRAKAHRKCAEVNMKTNKILYQRHKTPKQVFVYEHIH